MNEKDWYSTSWDYFALLSEQRMKMIEFFITIELALVAAFMTLVCLDQRLCWAEVTVSALISIVSIVFCGLDHRTKTMIHACEENMEKIEGRITKGPITKVNNYKSGRINITYTKWLRFLYGLFFAMGVVGVALVLTGVL